MSSIEDKEYTMSVNEFNEPLVYTGKDSTALKILRLLLLEPGTINCRPEMGIGIVSKYRFSMEDDLSNLSGNIKEQIKMYLPDSILHEVQLELKEKKLYISIRIDEDFYIYDLDEESKILSLTDLSSL